MKQNDKNPVYPPPPHGRNEGGVGEGTGGREKEFVWGLSGTEEEQIWGGWLPITN